MQYAEQVYTQIQNMPEFLQMQVLEFVNFLQWKTQQGYDKTELQEDYALGLAMEQAKNEPTYSREEALKMLEMKVA